MTIGQRIAQNRKALGLSQEALGEKLGVSRQSIYKWESDAALPEIDKLITLSKLFGLSVGALLGVEEEAAEQETAPSPDLTEQQLKMVEEITSRYLAAAPGQKARRLSLLSAAALVLTGVCIIAAFISLSNRLERMDQRYSSLQSSITVVSRTVDNQINAIAGQMTDLLKAQNDLVSDYDAQVVSVDPEAGTVTFSFRATPKTLTEGTVAYLEVVNKNATTTYGPYEPLSNGVFIGSETVSLHDDIRLSVIFDVGGVRFTQLIGEFTGLYSDTLPTLSAQFLGGIGVYRAGAEPNTFFLQDTYIYLTEPLGEDIVSARFGVFLNQQLLAWAEPTDAVPEGYEGSSAEFTAYDFYRIPDLTPAYQWGDELTAAALVTDRYGRESLHIIAQWELQTDDKGWCSPVEYAMADGSCHPDPADWTFH